MGKNLYTNKRFNIKTDIKISKIIKRIQNDEDETDNKLVIPEYQRDYVWNDIKDVPKFLTSLYIGYPIGLITLWDNHKIEQLQLIDGLQRHYTIYKIYEKPFNYLTYRMFEYWAKEKGIQLDEVVDKENFRHFRSNLNHKNNNYRKATLETINKWIDTTSRLEDKPEFRAHYKNFIIDYKEWFDKDFQEIIIPHNVLKDFNGDEVAEIFEIMNTTGKKLNNFEVASAKWSNYKIKIDKKVNFINTFIDNRKERYLSNFEDPESISENLINYDSKEIIPSNFICAIFEESLKDNKEFWYSFYDSNGILISKTIEAATEIVMEALVKLYNLGQTSIEDLGKKLMENIKTEENVNSLVEIISLAFKKVIGDIKFIQFARTNDSTKNIKYPSWLISAFVILNIRGATSSQRKNFNKWFIYEMLISNGYSSNTGNYARTNMHKYLSELKSDGGNKISDEELVKQIVVEIDNNPTGNDAKLILCLAQSQNYLPAASYHIDHLIPQAKLKSNKKINKDSIYNLHYLNSTTNEQKGDLLLVNQIDWDSFKKDILESKDDKEYNKLIKKMITEFENESKISEDTFDKLTSIRRKIMIKNLNQKSWL